MAEYGRGARPNYNRVLYKTYNGKRVDMTVGQLQQVNSYTTADIIEINNEGFNAGREVGVRMGKKAANKFAYNKGRFHGAIAGFLICCTLATGVHLTANAIHANDYSTASFDSGYKIVSTETHRTMDNEGFWYNTRAIADSYDPSTMNFDEFVFGVFSRIGYNQANKVKQMEEVFRQMGVGTSFESYVKSCGGIDKNGEVSYERYSELGRELIKNQGKIAELQEETQGFGRGGL